ncbi:MAG TPA: cellulase family glycosylhydrolase [Planctomycetota bacterium]|jgi:endoglycosylceramidase|nr:cellulase family glycosylhydrolase [Planctomycetota bacterium]
MLNLILILPLCVAPAQPATGELLPIRYLVDDQGRELVLHGLNISNAAKSDPRGMAWHKRADYARMGEWGFNAIRLLWFWSVLESQEGLYDIGYLDRLRKRLDWAQENGLKVILDMHQDLYGPKFTGDGAPLWATLDEDIPFEPTTPWWLNYLHPAVRTSFSNLWHDLWLQQKYQRAWQLVALHLGDHPAVISYDLMNEPFHGDEDLTTFEAQYLKPFYHGIAQAIRQVRPEANIGFEPVAFPTASGLLSNMPAFGDDNALYLPHYYDPFVHEGLAYHGNRWVVMLAISMKAVEANRHEVPMVLGEWGVLSSSPGWDDYVSDVLDALDIYSSGWTWWAYDRGSGFAILNADGSENERLQPLVRTYPQAVAGHIVSQGFNAATRIFEMEFTNNPAASGPTEIFVPAERLYGGSFQLTFSDPDGAWSYSFDDSRQVLALVHDPGTESHTVRITP